MLLEREHSTPCWATYSCLKTISPCPVTTCPYKKSLPRFPFFHVQVLEGSYKVSSEPSRLQAEKPQLTQPAFVGEVLQPSDHLHGPSVDLLQQSHVLLVLGAPGLIAVLQLGSHKSRIEGQNHLPWSASHISLDATLDTVGFLGCKCTLSAHVKSFIKWHSPILLLRAALKPFFAQPVPVLGIVWPRCRTLHLALLNFMKWHGHTVCPGPSGCHLFTPTFQLHHSPWCYLQTCWGCICSYCACGLQRCYITSVPALIPEECHSLLVSTRTSSHWLQLWVWPFSQFLIQRVVHPSNPFFSNLVTRMSCRPGSNALHKSR